MRTLIALMTAFVLALAPAGAPAGAAARPDSLPLCGLFPALPWCPHHG